MYIKNAFSLMMNNINVLFKAIVFNIVIITVTILAIHFILLSSLEHVISSAEWKVFLEAVNSSLRNIMQGKFSAVQDLSPVFNELLAVFKSNEIVLLIGFLSMLLVLFIALYLQGICKYTMCAIINGHMSSISKLPFIQTMLVTLKKSAPFELLFSVIHSLVVLVLLAIVLLFVVYTIGFLSVFSVMFAGWLFFIGYGYFLAVTTNIRPNIVNGGAIGKSFKLKIERKDMLNVFPRYVVCLVLLCSFNVILAITTLGAGTLISLAFSNLFTVCLQLVIFYALDGRKYYLDFDHIVTPKKLRTDDAKYLEEI